MPYFEEFKAYWIMYIFFIFLIAANLRMSPLDTYTDVRKMLHVSHPVYFILGMMYTGTRCSYLTLFDFSTKLENILGLWMYCIICPCNLYVYALNLKIYGDEEKLIMRWIVYVCAYLSKCGRISSNYVTLQRSNNKLALSTVIKISW